MSLATEPTGVTCKHCHGRIDVVMFDLTRKICDRRGLPVCTPKVCSECMLASIDRMAEDEEDPPTCLA